jgi:hypothetical protein
MVRPIVWLLAALIVLGTAPPLAAQQPPEGEEVVPPVMPPQSISMLLRNAGYTITEEEARYLDADEQLTDRFVAPILTVEMHAQTINDEFSRQVVLNQLRQVTSLDPTANSVAAPASLAELHRIAVARRTALRDAAQQWLAGLEASDPQWVARGVEPYGAARQGEADWLTALRQRLTAQPGGAAPGGAPPGAQP